ncbi:MAG: uroporphyrinogen decarboxylase [Rhodospirillales bacterium]
MSKRLLRAFTDEPVDRPPFWFLRQAGRYLPEYQQLRRGTPNFLTFCYTPELCIEAVMQPLRRYGMDAAILFSDILVIPDALGRSVRFVEGQGPVLEPLRRADEIPAFDRSQLDERLAPVYAAVAGLFRTLPAETTLIGFAGAPWTLALYMIEGQGGTAGERARAWAWREPDTFGRLVSVLVDAVSHCLCRQIDHGAEVVQLFDSWAGLLPETQFRNLVIAPTAAIVRRLKKHAPRVSIIGFPRAAGVLYEAYAHETGVDAVGLDAGVPAEWAATVLKPGCTLQGNLDNLLAVAGGEALEAETRRILRTLGPDRFIFNLGHGVLPDTPPEHIACIADLVRGWARQ